MRSIRVLALLTGLFFVYASPASAGDFSPPVELIACGELDIAEDAMADPTTAFLFAETPELCAKLCALSGKTCRAYAKEVIACRLRLVANTRAFGKLNCESAVADPVAAKACKLNVVASTAATIDDLKVERQFQLADCDDWADTCRAACVAP